jgi:hypothetical protein
MVQGERVVVPPRDAAVRTLWQSDSMHPLPPVLHALNETIAFLLELAMLAALGVWGAKAGASVASSILLGAGAPLLAIIGWGLFASPKAKITLPLAGVVAFKALAFGCGAAALYAAGRPKLALAFGAVAFVNTAIATVDRRARR